MKSDALARADRLTERKQVDRDVATVLDEYGNPTVLLERVERSGPVMEPSYNALLMQAQMITEVSQDAKFLAEREKDAALARARRARDKRRARYAYIASLRVKSERRSGRRAVVR